MLCYIMLSSAVDIVFGLNVTKAFILYFKDIYMVVSRLFLGCLVTVLLFDHTHE